MFNKYQSTGYQANAAPTGFDDVGKRTETCSLVEFYNMIKDHGITSKILPKNDLSNLFRAMNKHKTGRGDLSPFTLEVFEEFFFQVSYYIFTRPPFDYDNRPPVDSLRAMFD